MELRSTAKLLVGLAAGVLLVGLGSGVWELLAAQAPFTPLHTGTLSAPVRQLRQTCFTLSLLYFAAAWLLPLYAPDKEPRVLAAVLVTGTSITLVAMIWAASVGMMGLQAFDPRSDARALFYVRVTGQGLLLVAGLDFARRLLQGLRRSS